MILGRAELAQRRVRGQSWALALCHGEGSALRIGGILGVLRPVCGNCHAEPVLGTFAVFPLWEVTPLSC